MIRNALRTKLLPVIALLGSLGVAWGEPAATFRDLAGTCWSSHGFGYVLEFGGEDTFVLHEATPPLGSMRLTAGTVQSDAGVSRLISGESSAVFDQGEVIGAIRTDGDALRVNRPGTRDEIVFTRLAERPRILDQAPDASPRGVLEYFRRLEESHHAYLQDRLDELAIPAGLLPEGTTWNAACAAAAKRLAPDTGRLELCNVLWRLLEPLGDVHTSLSDPGDHSCDHDAWHPQTFATMCPGVPIQDVDEDEMEKLVDRGFGIVDGKFLDDRGLTPIANRKILYGVIRGQPILYMRIVSFSHFARGGEFEAELRNLQTGLDEAAASYNKERLQAVVVDLRDNDGGSDALGIEIASRFNHTPYTAYIEVARYDPDDPASYTAPQTMRVPVSDRPGFRDAPVVLLTSRLTISAGETFTMAMMERGPDERPVLRVGEPTQGVFADVPTWLLPNGMVLGIPNERYLTTTGKNFEIHGIPPDIEVPVWAPADVEAGRDPALQQAIEEILRVL
jgi:Peptidase family S41